LEDEGIRVMLRSARAAGVSATVGLVVFPSGGSIFDLATGDSACNDSADGSSGGAQDNSSGGTSFFSVMGKISSVREDRGDMFIGRPAPLRMRVVRKSFMTFPFVLWIPPAG
jgi:hypothetical protein